MQFSVYEALVFFLILLASLSVHEWAHAWTAEKAGRLDRAPHGPGDFQSHPPYRSGGARSSSRRFSSSSQGGAFFAWAKPVPVNPRNFGKTKRDDILVAMAGPASNLVICLVVAVLFGLAFRVGDPSAFLELAGNVIFINAFLWSST